jgi:hypothetical protein
MTFYIKDTTLPSRVVTQFNTYPELVRYLSEVSKRAYGQNMQQRTILLEEIGYGKDDHNATLFVRSMQEKFEIGIIREGRCTRCDVTTIVAYQKPEYGD